MFVAREIPAEHKDLIHDVSYDYHGRRMATCSSDQSVKVRYDNITILLKWKECLETLAVLQPIEEYSCMWPLVRTALGPDTRRL